ncbi:vacuolar protein sorting vps16 [Anaeramoeba flamelloides]|uniref:Vacuolar protein sorting vps16 n=1 Tax=Anaeramoeba flamelloides TaxID=1746091 RepID=A0AAV7ZNM8_9EUKA|nr:vacuolar protein sorting vps16 [Anaeramoeba flamelloides]KAJ6232126.1 vacuolar protein sorting vps16 [Anaeramoeba flamelloides]
MNIDQFGWVKLGNLNYHLQTLNLVQWKEDRIKLSEQEISVSRKGGPIAVTNSIHKISKYEKRRKILLFTSSGDYLTTITVRKEKKIYALGWHEGDELVCVLEDCEILVYSLRGELLENIEIVDSDSLSKKEKKEEKNKRRRRGTGGLGRVIRINSLIEFLDQKPEFVEIFPRGVLIYTDNNDIYLWYKGQKNFIYYPHLGIKTQPLCVSIIDQTINEQPSPIILIGLKDSTIKVITLNKDMNKNKTIQIQRVQLFKLNFQQIKIGTIETQSPAVKMSVSVSGKKFCYLTESGKVFITQEDLTSIIAIHQVNIGDLKQEKYFHNNLVWCSDDAILLHLCKPKRHLLMLGPNNTQKKFPLNDDCILISEIDGTRILLTKPFRLEFLSKVPAQVVNAFEIGSESPSSTLIHCLQLYQNKDPNADLLIRSMNKKLVRAIRECIFAAGYMIHPQAQEQLLQAASFGSSYINNSNSGFNNTSFRINKNKLVTQFAEMCYDLRILNTVRKPNIGISLTYQQLKSLGRDNLIKRLMYYMKHFIAIRICQFLKLSSNIEALVLEDWACSKILYSPNLNDKFLAKQIYEKIKMADKTHSVSFANIAKVAFQFQRKKLATKLLTLETKPQNQIPMLLEMDEIGKALKYSLDCGETELIYLVLKSLIKKFLINNNMKNINDNLNLSSKDNNNNLVTILEENFEKILPYLINYLQINNWKNLANLLLNFQKNKDLAILQSIQFFKTSSPKKKILILEEAVKNFNQSNEKIWKNLTLEQLKLLKLQTQITKTLTKKKKINFNIDIYGLSVSETLIQLIKLDQKKFIELIRKEFKIPEQRYWWLKITTLAQENRWDDLKKFSNQKSPIGYIPFFQICCDHNNLFQAEFYISKIPDIHTRFESYIQIKKFKMAAKIAVKLNNQELLDKVRSLAPKKVKLPKLVNRKK